MDATALIQNLIDAIDAIASRELSGTSSALSQIEDAKETASLAKLVLPTIAAPVSAPVGEWYALNNDAPALYGPFADVAQAEAYGKANLDPQGAAWHCDKAIPATVVAPGAAPQSAPVNAPGSPLTGGPSGTIPLPPHAPACSQCSATLDANGDCPDAACASYTPAKGYDDTLDDLKANLPGRPGSVIANKPSGSLYRQ